MFTAWLVIDNMNGGILDVCETEGGAEAMADDFRFEDLKIKGSTQENQYVVVRAEYVGDIPASMYLACNWKEV